MLNIAPSEFSEAGLPARTSVDSMWAMGTGAFTLLPMSTAIKNSHMRQRARGLFCAQLLTRVLYPLAKAPIARHLAADFIYAVNHRRVISAAERLPDFHQLHFQELTGQIHGDLPRYRERLDPRF